MVNNSHLERVNEVVRKLGGGRIDELEGDNWSRREVIRRILSEQRLERWTYGEHTTAHETRILLAQDHKGRFELTAYLDQVVPGIDATWGALIDSDGRLLEVAYGTKDATGKEWIADSFESLIPNADLNVEKSASRQVNWLLAQILSGCLLSPGHVNPSRRI